MTSRSRDHAPPSWIRLSDELGHTLTSQDHTDDICHASEGCNLVISRFIQLMLTLTCLTTTLKVSAGAAVDAVRLSVDKGYVELSAAKGRARRGAVNISMQGEGSDFLVDVSCVDGSFARVVSSTRDGEADDYPISIRAPGLSLEPSGSFDAAGRGGYVNGPHLTFSDPARELKLGQKLECSFDFVKSGSVRTTLYPIANIEDLIKF